MTDCLPASAGRNQLCRAAHGPPRLELVCGSLDGQRECLALARDRLSVQPRNGQRHALRPLHLHQANRATSQMHRSSDDKGRIRGAARTETYATPLRGSTRTRSGAKSSNSAQSRPSTSSRSFSGSPDMYTVRTAWSCAPLQRHASNKVP